MIGNRSDRPIPPTIAVRREFRRGSKGKKPGKSGRLAAAHTSITTMGRAITPLAEERWRWNVPLWFRFVFYACLGVAAEIVFTAACAKLGLALTWDLDEPAARTSWRLKGHSFVWMVPIYGFGLLAFERVHDVLRSAPWGVRGAGYVLGLYVLELACGAMLLALTGAHVWRWKGRGSIGGHIHLAMAPAWFVATLALEPLHDLLIRGPAALVP